MGVPTSRDVDQLSKRVAQLDRNVSALVGRKSASRRKAHR
jgi:outer membrane murein-binding lipoprotein Lpp